METDVLPFMQVLVKVYPDEGESWRSVAKSNSVIKGLCAQETVIELTATSYLYDTYCTYYD